MTPDDVMKLDNALCLALPKNDAGAETVRGYLYALLEAVWEEEEGFSGKRPFGNSGWKRDVIGPLVKARYTTPAKADAFVSRLILHAFGYEAPQ